MKVVFLCAGYATRLYPLTQDTPKPLLPVGGRPILEWILDRVREIANVEAVYIVTNHRFAGKFESWARENQHVWPVEVIDDQTTTNENRLGAIGDLNFSLQQKNIGEEDLLVLAGDNLFNFDLAYFVQHAQEKRPHPVIAVYDVKSLELAKHYGLVTLSAEGKVQEFFEKPENPCTTLASCGIYWLPAQSRRYLDRYLKEGNNPDQPGHYMRWLASNAGLFGVSLQGQWLDIGDHASYEQANKNFKEFHV